MTTQTDVANLRDTTLERNVFIRNWRTARRRVLRFGRALVEVVPARGCRGSARAASVLATAFAASAEQDDVIADDVGHVFFLTGLLVVPGVGSDAAFDINLAALLQILSGDLRQSLPKHDVVPFSAVLPVAVFVLVALIGRQGKFGHRLALRRVFVLGILAQVFGQNDFVYAFHDCELL